MRRRGSAQGPRTTCLPVFIQPGRRPVFQGTDQVGGNDVACSNCGNLLARNILPRQLWNIVIVCFDCGHRHETLRWEPGIPIGSRVWPTKPSVSAIAPDRTIDLDNGLVLASFECHQRRHEERARLAAPVTAPHLRFLDDQEVLDELVRQADLLLTDVLKSSPSMPFPRHPLKLLAARARAVAETGRVDLEAVLGLSLILDLVQAWRNDPAWTMIRKELSNPGQFAHTVIGLAAGAIFSAWGNDIGFQRQRPGKRTADMLCVVDASERLAIEIKVPQRFEVAGAPLTETAAAEIVRAALDSAGTSRRGQLSPEHPGMLVIGGFHVGAESIQCLREATGRCLGGQPPHVAAVMVLSLGLDVSGSSAVTSPPRFAADDSTAVVVLHEVIRNPGYQGRVALNAREIEGLRRRPW